MKKYIRPVACVAFMAAGILTSPLMAQNDGATGSSGGAFKKVGASGGQFLKIPVGARATGMAGAFNAISDDVTAIYWNPSGLSKLRTVNANVTYKATPRFTITSNSGYFVPIRTPNNTFPDNYFYGYNFAHKFFKQKLTITATITNFFEEKRKLKFLTENENFVTENTHTIPFRNFGLALSYSFGRLKENVSKKKGVTNDDLVQ